MSGGLATLGDISFRINPSDINWNYQINTNVEETVGGRVIQVIGSTLSNLTVKGFYGQSAIQSCDMADSFVDRIRTLMDLQNATATIPAKMAPTQVFTYSPYKWKFDVYIISIDDPGGGSVHHETGKFSYEYTLSLFIVQDGSADAVLPGSTNGAIDKTSSGAVKSYINRISNGFGWKLTGFNDPDILKDIAGNKLTVTEADFDKMGFYKRNQVTFAAPNWGGGSTTTTSPTGPGTGGAATGPIYCTGDSLMVGLKTAGLESKLKAAGFTAQVDGVGGGTIKTSGMGSPAIARATAAAAFIKTATGVVMELGTNKEPGYSAAYHELVTKIKSYAPNAVLFAVNMCAGSTSTNYSAENTVVSGLGATVIDWKSLGDAHKSWFSGAGGVHPSGAGYTAMADLIVKTVKGSSAGAPVGGKFPITAGPAKGISAADWALVVKYANISGVDPYLLVAIGFHETGWGTLGAGRNNGNVLGVGAYNNNPNNPTFSGLERQLKVGAEKLKKDKVFTITDVDRYTKHTDGVLWATDGGWAAAVKKQYAQHKP